MNFYLKSVFLGLLLLPLLEAVAQLPTQAQVASDQTTGTQVNLAGNQFNISGGLTSLDNTNLFHSFSQFGLNQQQIANFLSTPNIRNILGRVTGGDASIINGLLQISGSNANLYLMNPAGIIFGPSAGLNLPAAFTATTASGIGFGSQWFTVTGSTSTYRALLGAPTGFQFNSSNPGKIVNQANLQLRPGQELTLLEPPVTQASVGQIPASPLTITTVPDSGLVRIAQPGQLLSLEVKSDDLPNSANGITPQSLPQLLTGASVTGATSLQVNSDGVIRAIGADQPGANPQEIIAKLSPTAGPLPPENTPLPVNGQLQTTATLGLSTPTPLLAINSQLQATADLNSLSPGSSLPSNIQLQAALNLSPPILNNSGTINSQLHVTVNPSPLTPDPLNPPTINQPVLTPGTPQTGSNSPLPGDQGTQISELQPGSPQLRGPLGQLSDSLQQPEILTRPTATSISRDPTVTPTQVGQALAQDQLEQNVALVDSRFTTAFDRYLGRQSVSAELTTGEIVNLLRQTQTQGGNTAAVYAVFVPDTPGQHAGKGRVEHLELMMITADGKVFHHRLPEATRQLVLKTAKQLSIEVRDPSKVRSTSYLAPAQQLYQWLVAPLAAELRASEIENLAFVMDEGLRSIPIAALHDVTTQQFLVEQYSIGLVPSFSLLVDAAYKPVQDTQVLAMGASEFPEGEPLPAVPPELATIAKLWSSQTYLNEGFTVDTLTTELNQTPYGIVHLATHAYFNAGDRNQSYIDFREQKLTLAELPQLNWNNSLIDLVVLSGCQTALGDRDAELGFAGFVVQAGVKSALASLWRASDSGTLVLMSHFYKALQAAPTKARALQQAQLAMLHRVQPTIVSQMLLASQSQSSDVTPQEIQWQNQDFSHPYYWSTFTLIGTPW